MKNQVRAKPQTPAQRVANPVWLREQIGKLILDCDAFIKDDAARAENGGDSEAVYEALIASRQLWKTKLERILHGDASPTEGIYELCERLFRTTLPRDLYDAIARAFGTTRDDAKERLLAVMYGKPGKATS